MFPVAVKVDADTLEEVFLTPHYSDGPTDAIVIDYNSDSNNFVIASAVSLTYSFGGRPAVADFDYDGRVEFISGGIDGYGLLEWRDGQLNYIGRLETDQADRHFATVTRPFPGGAPHALLSYMGATGLGYIYKLMQATGDNQFQMAHTFQEVTGFRGGETCWSDDVDCDGFDEIVMSFIPEFKVFEWSVEGDSFTADCTWHMDTVGAILLYWYSADLNWNGVKDWCTVGADGVLRVYPDPDCIGCDSTGACTAIPWSCNCDCLADPQCDGQITVLDVVATVDVAFRGIPAASDPDENCPFKRADVDCSSSISVVDVVKLVNVAFRQADPGYWFCDPCP